MTLPKTNKPIKIWDIPTRLFHWSLAILVTATWIFGKQQMMQWHLLGGFAVLTLVIFRVIWGFVGSFHARFSNFILSPLKVIQHAKTLLKGQDAPYAGHNPLGGYNILAMLGVLLFQAGTGLFATDDILTEGPLSYLLSTDSVKFLTACHKTSETLLLVLIGLHLLAVLFYHCVKKEHLTKAMVTGIKNLDSKQENIQERPFLAPVVLLGCMLFVWALANQVWRF